MNREQITPEIIELAKQIWKKGWRQDICEGDWYLFSSTKKAMRDVLCLHSGNKPINLSAIDKYTTIIPIPDLSTCLAWIEERGIRFYAFAMRDKKPMFICDVPGDSLWIKAETREEAAMLAMLKILEGE